MLNKNYERENRHLIEVLRNYSEDIVLMNQNQKATVNLFLNNIRVVIRSQGKGGVILNNKLKNLLVYLNSII